MPKGTGPSDKDETKPKKASRYSAATRKASSTINFEHIRQVSYTGIPNRISENQRRLPRLPLPTKTLTPIAQLYVDLKRENVERAARLVQDTELNDDLAIPVEHEYLSGSKAKETGCCGQALLRKKVHQAFQDPVYKKNFVSKVMLIMFCTQIPAFVWTFFTVTNERIHNFLIEDAYLYFIVSALTWVGFNIVGRLVQKKAVLIVNFIFRALALANFLAAVQIILERQVATATYSTPIFLNASDTRTHMLSQHGIEVNMTLEISPTGFKPKRFSRGMCGLGLVCTLEFCWLSIYISLRCFSRWIQHIPGFWMPIVGGLAAFSLPVIIMYVFGVFKVSPGPPAWDIPQFYFFISCGIIESVVSKKHRSSSFVVRCTTVRPVFL